MNANLLHKTVLCDICIVGGGLSGSFAALAAARRGQSVVIIQDRPMLGGNASSEIRMWIRGATRPFDRESGYISELEQRNIYKNPSLVHSVFDATLYGMLVENKNITMLLNASCCDAKTDGNKIVSVSAWQMTTYTWYTVEAKIFADCSGDSILAPLVGAEHRKGREAKSEYNETLAKDVADEHTMGMSIILAARETDHPVKFVRPDFANIYPTDESFSGDENAVRHALTRDHDVGTSKTNLWWIELGGHCDSIHDAEKMRKELLASVYGVWDHIKNQGDHGKENWELEWVGFLPGKRESRRYIGDTVVTESDILSGGDFSDEVAYGGWPLDDHNPYGMMKNSESNVASISIPLDKIYGLPYSSLYSKNVENLMFAGRNVSVTHVALSSTRVMATCSLLGQAMGTGASLAVKYNCTPGKVGEEHIKELQKELLDDGMFLPHIKREQSELAKKAKLNISHSERETLFNGVERPRTEIGENLISQNVGDSLIFDFDRESTVKTLRLVFDPDYSRESISENRKMRVFAMKLNTGKDFKPVKVANTLVKSFAVYADGKEICTVEENYLSLVKIPLNVTAKRLEIKWLATWGAEKVNLYSADFI